MEREECLILGKVVKSQGLTGEVKCLFDVQDINDYAKARNLYLGKEGAPLERFEVRKVSIRGPQTAVLTFRTIKDRNAADALIGYTIYFPEKDLAPLPEGGFYYYQTLGFKVVDEQLGELGTVKEYIDGAAHDLMVMEYEGKEVLVPVTDMFIPRADLPSKTLHTRLPEGLLDLYLGTDTDDE